MTDTLTAAPPERKTVPAQFVTVWDGGEIVSTDCVYDPATNVVSEIVTVDSDLECLERTYVELPNGTEIDTFHDDDNDATYVGGFREDES